MIPIYKDRYGDGIPCNLRAGEAETRRSWGLIARQAIIIGRVQASERSHLTRYNEWLLRESLKFDL